MLFETQGLNKNRLKTLSKLYSERKVSGQLSRLITHDSLFQVEPELAYTVSWVVAHYLSTKKPKAFFAYLKEDSERSNFHPNPPADRLKAFAKHFGHDLDELQEKMRVFYR